MTTETLFAKAQQSWAVLTLAGVIAGALGVKVITPEQQLAASAVDVAKNATQIEYNTKRIDRLETAMTILALKACSDVTLARYEAIQLQCAQLGSPK